MTQDFIKNYIKIYVWKTGSIIMGFLSMLIVLPSLANNLELFGVYSFCISLTMYLTYSDLGFLGAGQKYAAEAFALGDSKKELELLGFTMMLLILMIAPFSILMVTFSVDPILIIADLGLEGRDIARSMFLIIGLVLPVQIILQRLSQSILTVRVMDYVGLKVDVFVNLIKISSVFYFFSSDNYKIIEFFLFSTLLTIGSQLYVLYRIRKVEKIDFWWLLKSIKFSKKYYRIMKRLAWGSFALTFGWLIYYELDLLIIGKLFGVYEVGIYAVAFTFLNFLRSLWNSVFLPFAQRFNHFVAEKKHFEIKKFLNSLIEYTLPLNVLVTVILFLYCDKLVLYWVGEDYGESVIILKILIIGNLFSFLNIPASHYFSALRCYNYLYLLAIVFPTVFLGIVYLTYSDFGLIGIALAKTITNSVAFIISLAGIIKVFSAFQIFARWFFPLISVFGIYWFGFMGVTDELLVADCKSSFELLKLIFFLGIITAISYSFLLLCLKKNRVYLLKFSGLNVIRK